MLIFIASSQINNKNAFITASFELIRASLSVLGHWSDHSKMVALRIVINNCSLQQKVQR